jgi:diguanylate cyclase (GGDEF)-like protein
MKSWALGLPSMRSSNTNLVFADELAGLLTALAVTNEAILRNSHRDDLLQKVCDALVEGGPIVSAAIFFDQPELNALMRMATAGDGMGATRQYLISRSEDCLECDAAAIAFQTQRPYISKPSFASRSITPTPTSVIAAVPLFQGCRAVGAIQMLVKNCEILTDSVVALVARTVDNISFALGNERPPADGSNKALRRLATMLAAAGSTNEAILHATSPDDLLRRSCDAAVCNGRSWAAAMLMIEPESHWFRLAAERGDFCRLLNQARFSTDPTHPFGEGPWAEAFAAQKISIGSAKGLKGTKTRVARTSIDDSDVACVAMPLICNGPVGVAVYVVRKSWLAEGEVVALIRRSVENISFGLQKFDQEERRKQAEAHIQHLATHDALTGLANRVRFGDRLEEALSRTGSGAIVAVHLLDLDRFKCVNDTMGHPIGDQLLLAVANRLRETVGSGDTIARLGGDEFAIIQVDVKSSAEVLALPARIIDSLRATFQIGGRCLSIGTSIGTAIAPADGLTPEELLRKADIALYAAKDTGRGSHRLFESHMDADAIGANI